MTESTAILTLTDFLLARIAEDEAAAKVASRFPTESSGWLRGEEGVGHSYVGFHDKSGSPARVLAECEAKRRIVERASRPVYRHTFDPTRPPNPFSELTFSGGRVYADPHHEVDVTETYQGEVAANSEPADAATLRDLASVYNNHPDFREEWKP